MFNIINTTENLEFDPINYISKPYKKPVEPEVVLDPEVEKIRRVIKYMESRGEANKGLNVDYSFSKPSGNPKDPNYLGLALGAYQITEARLREKGKSFLGKKVTKDEFLASPALQDQFMRGQISWQKKMGMLLDSIFATHRGGWGKLTRKDMIDRKTQYEQYVKEAMAQYNKETQEELAELEDKKKKAAAKESETKEKPSMLSSMIAGLVRSISNKKK